MIYWFTGQPGHGKTVLAKMLKEHITQKNINNLVFHIDGDDLRDLLVNKDYSKQGRENNIRTAQALALYLENKGHDVVVSLVAPYRELREEFKDRSNIQEIYVHTTEQRGRENYHVQDYEAPLEDFIDLDTTDCEPIGSLKHLLNKLGL